MNSNWCEDGSLSFWVGFQLPLLSPLELEVATALLLQELTTRASVVPLCK